jgi:type I restriction enzyme, S subunit
MSDLPNSWMKPAISEIAEVNPRKDVDLSTSELVSFVPMAAVDEVSGTILSPVDRPYGEVSKGFTHFRDEDVIFAKITPSMENGKSAVARGLTNGTGMGSTEFHVFRSGGAVEPEFLWRYVRQKSFREDAQAVMSGAVGQQRVPADWLKDHLIPLPPLPEQRRIMTKVDGLTARTARARKELDRIPILIARYKQRLLALAAEGLLTRNWRGETHAAEWKQTTVVDLAETTFDGPFGSNLKSADYVDSGVRVVRLENIGNLRFIREKETFISKAKFKSLQRHELKPDDVIFSSFIAEEIRVCLLPKDLETVAINKADCFCVRVDRQKCLPQFLAYRLASPTCYEVLKEGVHGATRPRISLTHLKQFQIDLPPLEEQAEIVRRIESAFGWLDRMATDHAAAARLIPKLDAAILSKAFRGDLVPQDPNDEPASALLDRIKNESLRRLFTNAKVFNVDGIKPGSSKRQVRDRVRRVIGKALKEMAGAKSRQDDDVRDQPYLAGKLKGLPRADVQTLFRAADLPVADFYKQLAWEIGNGHIVDSAETLKAA